MPTVLRLGRFRFFFFSNESQEPAHIHVQADEAKFWLDPVQVAANYGFNASELNEIQQAVEQHRDGLLEAWNEYFSARSKPVVSVRGKKPKPQRAFVPVSALAKAVEFDDIMMRVTLTDGRELGVPLAWFPSLLEATPKQRAHYELGGGGISLHWPDLDEDLSVAGLMAGVDWRSA